MSAVPVAEGVSGRRVSGVFFASGPGFWETRPAFWLFVLAAVACLLFVSRVAGWSALALLLAGSRLSKQRWRRRERRRLMLTTG